MYRMCNATEHACRRYYRSTVIRCTRSRHTLCYRAALSLCVLALPVLAGSFPPGLENFQQVNDHIFRGAQPSNDGFKSLAKLGVKTILDLRESGARAVAESKMVEGLGMRYINIPLDGFRPPTAEQLEKVLKLFQDASIGPVFVHCRRGADRTGTVIAVYRIGHDHWDNQKALAEAKSFRMSSLEFLMQRFVLNYHPAAESAEASKAPADAIKAPTAAAAAAGVVQ